MITIPHNFIPYPYQYPVYNAIPDGYKRGFTVWHRRAGKDKTFMNILAREAVKRKGTYFYILPYYKQARMIIWEGTDNEGFRFIDHIPADLIRRKENQQMVIDLQTGSVLRFLGSDNIDSIVGTNPVGVLFSEYTLHKPQAWNYLRPILAQNQGWAFFNGTFRGRNHGYRLYKSAEKDPNWFNQILTVSDTSDHEGRPVVTEEAIEEERRSGMPPELIEQEFYCSPDAGLVGSYYSDILKKLTQSDPPQIDKVPYEPSIPVSTAWDLGVNDYTFIWFFQQYREEIRVINCYRNRNKPITHYLGYCSDLYDNYDYHLFPHDVKMRDKTTARPLLYRIREHRHFKHSIVVSKMKTLDTVEWANQVRETLMKCWFDELRCAIGLECLRNYHRQFDEKNNVFRNIPVHDEHSDGADAFRTLAMGIRAVKTKGQELLVKQSHAIGYDYNPLAPAPYRTQFEEHEFNHNDIWSDPNNYDPYTQTVTGNSLWR